MKRMMAAMATILLLVPVAHGATKVVAEAIGDINGDGVKDRAQLIADGDDVDVAVYLSAGGKLPAKPTVLKKALGDYSDVPGQEPELSISGKGSMIIVFKNEAIGRDRWHAQYTIAWRNGALVVAGYSFDYRDTLEPNRSGACDVNFLTGKGTALGKSITVPAHPVSLAAWGQSDIPAACQFD
jgi:hypothetical protein